MVVRRGAARACGPRRRTARGSLGAALAAHAQAAARTLPAAPAADAQALRLAPLQAALSLRDNRLELLPAPPPPADVAAPPQPGRYRRSVDRSDLACRDVS